MMSVCDECCVMSVLCDECDEWICVMSVCDEWMCDECLCVMSGYVSCDHLNVSE